ncbi:MAG TPA: QsdR family transcriptional regulator [Solirubrobacteraceae bacterium]|jgi:AcrR family transcriptional regulator|nr:QsdR family transcriptional regulator [Solirubrobacteraceae bacterium]
MPVRQQGETQPGESAAGAARARRSRATARDALELATATHLACRRVDMGTLARELGVARATLYRWFGSREALLEELLLARARAYAGHAHGQSDAQGDERLMQMVRGMVDSSRVATPVRKFVEREPRLALRILAGHDGRLHRFFVDLSLREIALTRGERQARELETTVDATVQLINTLIWMAVAIGEEPPAERVEELARELLAQNPAPRAGAGVTERGRATGTRARRVQPDSATPDPAA